MPAMVSPEAAKEKLKKCAKLLDHCTTCTHSLESLYETGTHLFAQLPTV